MKWFLNLTTRTKLLFGFGLMIFLLLMVFITAYAGLMKIQHFQNRVFETEFHNVKNLKGVRFNQNKIRTAAVTMLVTDGRAGLEGLLHEGNKLTKNNDELMKALLESEKGTAHGSRLEEFEALRVAFKETREKDVMPLIFSGKTEEAKRLLTTVQAERNAKMGTIIDGLVDDAEREFSAAMVESSRTVHRSLTVLVLLGAASVLLGVSIALYLNRVIAKPLKEVSNIAEMVASGDLAAGMSTNNRNDEVGALTKSFSRMTQYLRGMSEAAGRIASGDMTLNVKPLSDKDVFGNVFAEMVDNLRRLTTEIRGGADVLAAAASEILATTTQVASGATETATAVSETTTTVEEVKQTAQVSSQKAKYVSESAQKSAQAAASGRKSVEETVMGMERIREQMESVAESIVKLSEQSQAIGEIIATVNDLAEQSNLLAVNAAIEAAKAGEQGKGFAVVAQEIKSLAEQSRQATAQVRSILTDIQKATSAAVMATEQGSKAVEAGVKQAGQSGDSIRVLTDSVAEAAQAATQIAASSQQQLVGMEQVISAMENIKQATAQNVAGTKQTESAAQNLHELGQKLKQLVEQYKV